MAQCIGDDAPKTAGTHGFQEESGLFKNMLRPLPGPVPAGADHKQWQQGGKAVPAGAPRTAMADLEEAGVPSGPLSSEGDAVPASNNQENADPSDERSLRKMFQQGTEEIATHRCPQLWGWAKGVPSIPGASGMAHLSAGEVVEQSAGAAGAATAGGAAAAAAAAATFVLTLWPPGMALLHLLPSAGLTICSRSSAR